MLDAAVTMLEDSPMVTDAAITERTGFDLAGGARPRGPGMSGHAATLRVWTAS